MNTAYPHEPVLSIKQVGANGQISLGKEFAGQTVQVEQSEPGVWVVKAVLVIPVNEVWLHQPETYAGLQRALHWAGENSSAESDLTQLFGDESNGSEARENATGSGYSTATKRSATTKLNRSS